MKQLLLGFLLPLCSLHINAQTDNPVYDKAMADSLGGDDYGMKPYVLVILKTGTAKIDNNQVSDSLFKGHMTAIQKFADDGKLIVSGPLRKNEKAYRGIFILDVKTIEEAQVLIQSDPAINAKVFDVELFQWYGSAALPLYLPNHYKIEKKKM